MDSGVTPSSRAWCVDCRVDLEKQPGALEVAVLARDDQRRGASGVGLVDRCASLEEQPGDLGVAVLARDEQRRRAAAATTAAARRRPDARAGLKQQPRRLGLPVTSGPSSDQRVLLLSVSSRAALRLPRVRRPERWGCSEARSPAAMSASSVAGGLAAGAITESRRSGYVRGAGATVCIARRQRTALCLGRGLESASEGGPPLKAYARLPRRASTQKHNA